MTNLFARFYAASAVGHGLGILMWAAAATLLVPRVAEEHLAEVLDAPTAAMVEQLTAVGPDGRRAVVARWNDPRVSLTAPLDAGAVPLVRRDQVAVSVGYPMVHAYRVVDQDTWLHIGPIPLLPGGAELRWFLLAVLATVGVGTGAWIALRPTRRTLDHLAEVAQAFGAGDLGARAEIEGPRELTQVGEAFDAMADRIHALLRVQQETLQGVSHELRTPLTRASFALELVVDTEEREARRALADRVSADLEQMERLLEELLAYLRLDELQEPATEPTDLRELALKVAAAHDGVEVEGGGTASVEPRLLRRALRNLVANAARHSVERVVVTVEVTESAACITVDDDGAGFPDADRERLLQPFQRGQSARRLDPSGAGLGLPIAARVARAHGGTVDIDVSPAGGGRVRLRWPLSA